jgi:hypothetical protein
MSRTEISKSNADDRSTVQIGKTGRSLFFDRCSIFGVQKDALIFSVELTAPVKAISLSKSLHH